MIHWKQNRSHRTSKIVKSALSDNNGHLPLLLFTLLLSVRTRCMTWHVKFVRSKDAQKQLARTSLRLYSTLTGNQWLYLYFRLGIPRFTLILQKLHIWWAVICRQFQATPLPAEHLTVGFYIFSIVVMNVSTLTVFIERSNISMQETAHKYS